MYQIVSYQESGKQKYDAMHDCEWSKESVPRQSYLATHPLCLPLRGKLISWLSTRLYPTLNTRAFFPKHFSFVNISTDKEIFQTIMAQ